MSNETNQILAPALQLPPDARAFLAEKLLESLDAGVEFEISAAWRSEIAHRVAQLDRGDVELLPAEQAFQEAHRMIG